MTDASANEQPESGGEAAAGSWTPPAWVRDIVAAAAALRDLAAAQVTLLGAELRLARSAARSAIVALVVALVLVLALGFSLLALLTTLLAQWLGSWPLALAVLVLVQALLLAGTLWWFRRCLHWMSLPATRAEWHALVERARGTPGEQADEPASSSR